jgi:ribose 5-phosphate isomerase B
MRVAFTSDERYRVHDVLEADLNRRGHTVVRFGATATGSDVPWVDAAQAAAQAVSSGDCVQGVFLCWTGTGICMAANKVPGIRAALCTDPGTAAGARVWNHANVLCLSNRTLSDDMAREILAAWFDTPPEDRGTQGVARLAELESRYLKRP